MDRYCGTTGAQRLPLQHSARQGTSQSLALLPFPLAGVIARSVSSKAVLWHWHQWAQARRACAAYLFQSGLVGAEPFGSPTFVLRVETETEQGQRTSHGSDCFSHSRVNIFEKNELKFRLLVGCGPKAALLQTVSVRIAGHETDLAVVGIGLDTYDAAKDDQVRRLMAHLAKRRRAAENGGRKFQAILLGDLNERLVLKDDPGFKVHWSHMRNLKVGQLTHTTQAILRHLMTSAEGRHKLLSWHVGWFDGVAAGGVRLRPSLYRISRHFYLQTQWWRDAWLEPSHVTYKYTPWEQMVPEEVVRSVLGDRFGRLHVVAASEIQRALHEHGRSERCMNPSNMVGLFGMEGHIPKLKPHQATEQEQTYLNYDRHFRPVYLEFGWLDSVGFLKDGLEAKFLSFRTDFGVRAEDHALTVARLELGAPRSWWSWPMLGFLMGWSCG